MTVKPIINTYALMGPDSSPSAEMRENESGFSTFILFAHISFHSEPATDQV
jgi:hypothetical protein